MINIVRKKGLNLEVFYENEKKINVPKDKENRHYKEVLQWVEDGGVIEDEFTKDVLIKNAKVQKVIDVNSNCEDEIVSGFYSSVLGVKFFYYSTIAEQSTMNLLANINKGSSLKAQKVVKDNKGNEILEKRINYFHTAEQLRQILNDCLSHIRETIEKKDNLRDLINKAETIEEINKINW